MPSSLNKDQLGQQFGSEQWLVNPAMWSYGMIPLHQTVQPQQQYAYPMPFPVMMPHPVVPHPTWVSAENYSSLPSKSKKKIEHPQFEFKTPVKPTRRFSDPGPGATLAMNSLDIQANYNEPPVAKIPPSHYGNQFNNNQESWPFTEGASNDDIFSNLLQELRSARHLNRQLCLELHKAKMQVQLIQQQQNEQHQPGSVAALVQKLYEAHHIRSDILSSWQKSADDSFVGRRSSYSSSRFDADEHEESLLKQRETLIHRLQSTEKKIRFCRNNQWSGGGLTSALFNNQQAELRNPTVPISRCTGDVLTSCKTSRRHSFAMTSPSSSDPPSIDDVDLSSSKHYGGVVNGSPGLALPNLLLQAGRPLHHHEGRAYSSSSHNSSSAVAQAVSAAVVATAASTANGEAALKRDLEFQLANVERDRRQLAADLEKTIGIRHHSEDRIIKLERLVSVLRKKLEVQTAVSNLGSANVLPSPTESSETATADTSATSLDCPVTYPAFINRANQLLTDGPSSLPSYLQVVGPITQL